jgi:hypothetical protein
MSTTITRPRGRPRLDDSWLYDAETVRVGVLLFGARPCAACGTPLPACSDYFSPNHGGLKSACKRCTNARCLESNRRRRQRGRDEAKVERLVHDLCMRTALTA